MIELIVFNYIDKKEVDFIISLIENMKNVDALQYYISKMKESVTRKDGKAGLGLARINYEGEAEITVKYYEDSKIIQIRAVFKIL